MIAFICFVLAVLASPFKIAGQVAVFEQNAVLYSATIWMGSALPRLNCSLKLDRCLT